MHENAHISVKMHGNARIFTEMHVFSLKMHKTNFSEIGLASSKGLFFERPNQPIRLSLTFVRGGSDPG